MTAKKYYAVKVGRQPGIYHSWDECKNQIHGYTGAIYKGFPALEEANQYMLGGETKKKEPKSQANEVHCGFNIYVDGSFKKDEKRYSWAFVVYREQELVFSDCGVGENEEAASLHNVAGELAATMRAVKWARENGVRPVTIHHDYMGISAWAKREWKAKNKFTQAYTDFIAPHMEWIHFNKVKGHSGVAGNEMADKLAGQAFLRIEEGI